MFTLSAGYSVFLGKTTHVVIDDEGITYTPESYTAIPVKAGIKYHFTEGFYGEGQLGAAIGLKENSKVGLAYAPGLGYDFGGVDIGIRYEGWTVSATMGQVAAHLGFNF